MFSHPGRRKIILRPLYPVRDPQKSQLMHYNRLNIQLYNSKYPVRDNRVKKGQRCIPPSGHAGYMRLCTRLYNRRHTLWRTLATYQEHRRSGPQSGRTICSKASALSSTGISWRSSNDISDCILELRADYGHETKFIPFRPQKWPMWPYYDFVKLRRELQSKT